MFEDDTRKHHDLTRRTEIDRAGNPIRSQATVCNETEGEPFRKNSNDDNKKRKMILTHLNAKKDL